MELRGTRWLRQPTALPLWARSCSKKICIEAGGGCCLVAILVMVWRQAKAFLEACRQKKLFPWGSNFLLREGGSDWRLIENL